MFVSGEIVVLGAVLIAEDVDETFVTSSGGDGGPMVFVVEFVDVVIVSGSSELTESTESFFDLTDGGGVSGCTCGVVEGVTGTVMSWSVCGKVSSHISSRGRAKRLFCI